jgi:hypothetical protein
VIVIDVIVFVVVAVILIVIVTVLALKLSLYHLHFTSSNSKRKSLPRDVWAAGLVHGAVSLRVVASNLVQLLKRCYSPYGFIFIFMSCHSHNRWSRNSNNNQ